MKDTIQKAIEISDAKIQFVSLVDKAANKRQFLITKADEGQAQFSTVGKILKTDADTHYVTGIVYEPLTEDAHGNFMTEDEIRKAAYWFAKNGDKVDLQHSFEQADGLSVVENYVAPSDMEIDGTPIVKGTWLMTVEVQNEDVWSKVQKGEVTGFSMGGMGRYSETETDLTDTVEKQGLLKRLASFLGVDVITKGAVKDQYDKRRKSSDFWTAFNTLQDVLCKYGYQGEIFETDDTVIREALTDFVQIITDVMAEPNAEVLPSLLKSNKPPKNHLLSTSNKPIRNLLLLCDGISKFNQIFAYFIFNYTYLMRFFKGILKKIGAVYNKGCSLLFYFCKLCGISVASFYSLKLSLTLSAPNAINSLFVGFSLFIINRIAEKGVLRIKITLVPSSFYCVANCSFNSFCIFYK